MHEIDASTVALYRLNEPSGTKMLVDEANELYPLTATTGTVPYAAKNHWPTALALGSYNYASFDGSNRQFSEFSGFTIESWLSANLDQLSTAYAIVGSPDIQINGNTRSVYIVHHYYDTAWSTSSFDSGIDLPKSEGWSHLAVTITTPYQKGAPPSGIYYCTYRVYFNGVLQVTQEMSGGGYLAYPFWLTSLGSSTNGFVGLISDLRISSVVRSDAEIAASYAASENLPLIRNHKTIPPKQSEGIFRYTAIRTNYARSSQPVIGLFKTTEDVIPIDTFTADQVTAAAGSITITFSDPCVISGHATDPSEWTVADSNGKLLQIKTVTANSNTIILTTDEQTNGAHYSVVFPSTGIQDNKGKRLDGPFSMGFTGVGVAPTIVWSKAIDARHIEICFSEPVLESDATNIANYSINSNLQVLAAKKETNVTYRLTTSLQSSGTQYTITASNIRDLANNPV